MMKYCGAMGGGLSGGCIPGCTVNTAWCESTACLDLRNVKECAWQPDQLESLLIKQDRCNPYGHNEVCVSMRCACPYACVHWSCYIGESSCHISPIRASTCLMCAYKPTCMYMHKSHLIGIVLAQCHTTHTKAHGHDGEHVPTASCIRVHCSALILTLCTCCFATAELEFVLKRAWTSHL